ncbi:MAG: hypothetical protein ACRDSR_18140 [Pseudonocardiaceae bacterium]
MSIDDTLGGFVLDGSALAVLGGGENLYATTWADRAAVRGIVLLVPAVALSEAWQQIRRHDPSHVEQMADLLASPMVLIEALDDSAAARAGELVSGRDLDPDVAAAQVATCARARDWPVLAAVPARLLVIDPQLTVETLPGMS